MDQRTIEEEECYILIYHALSYKIHSSVFCTAVSGYSNLDLKYYVLIIIVKTSAVKA